MTVLEAWYVVFIPEYRYPTVFDLNEQGVFKTRPPVSKDYGVRLMANQNLNLRVQFVLLTQGTSVKQTGTTFSFMVTHALIDLTKSLTVDEKELAAKVSDHTLRKEISTACESWYESFVPLNQDGTIDRAEFERKLQISIKESKKFADKALIRRNSPWINSALPRKIFDFRHGLYQRMCDNLFSHYKQRGGEDSEKNLIKNINLFSLIYSGEDLVKPDGTRWKNKDEQWNCWVAFAGSESEAQRICSTMENVFPPVHEELARELESGG